MANTHDGAAGGVSAERASQLARGEITLGEFAGLGRERLYEIAAEGYRMLDAGRLDEALAVYRGLVAADPFDSVFRCHLAATQLRRGDADAALREFDAALRLNVANVDALSGRGEALLSRGRVAEAVRDLNAALELDPQLKRPTTERARSLLLALRQAAAATRSSAGRKG